MRTQMVLTLGLYASRQAEQADGSKGCAATVHSVIPSTRRSRKAIPSAWAPTGTSLSRVAAIIVSGNPLDPFNRAVSFKSLRSVDSTNERSLTAPFAHLAR